MNYKCKILTSNKNIFYYYVSSTKTQICLVTRLSGDVCFKAENKKSTTKENDIVTKIQY